jgi:hypothetical protein
MENGRGTHFQEDVPKTLLGQIERLRRLEHSFIKRGEAIDVVAQEGQMLDAFDKSHIPSGCSIVLTFLASSETQRPQLGSCLQDVERAIHETLERCLGFIRCVLHDTRLGPQVLRRRILDC